MTVMASGGPSPLAPSLRLGLAAHQPSKCHHAQSLLGPLIDACFYHLFWRNNVVLALELSRLFLPSLT